MIRESNQNVFWIQIDASKLAEFEISEFELSRFDCRCSEDCPSVNLGDRLHQDRVNIRFIPINSDVNIKVFILVTASHLKCGVWSFTMYVLSCPDSFEIRHFSFKDSHCLRKK